MHGMNHGKEYSRRREINNVTEGKGQNLHLILSRIPIKHIKQFKIRNMDIPIQGSLGNPSSLGTLPNLGPFP